LREGVRKGRENEVISAGDNGKGNNTFLGVIMGKAITLF